MPSFSSEAQGLMKPSLLAFRYRAAEFREFLTKSVSLTLQIYECLYRRIFVYNLSPFFVRQEISPFDFLRPTLCSRKIFYLLFSYKDSPRAQHYAMDHA